MPRRPERTPRPSAARSQAVSVERPSQAIAQDAHCVLLHQDDAYLATAMAVWAQEGLEGGEGVILIVRAAIGDRVRAGLQEAGADPRSWEATGRLRILDADATLRLFMVRGHPHDSLFSNVVAPLLDDVRAASPAGMVRAWGEMVDLLWQRAQGPAAVRLEELWAGLLATPGFRLFCSYRVDALDALQWPKVRAIAAGHGLVVSAEDEGGLEAAVDAALADTYGPEADAVRGFLGTDPAQRLPPPLHRLLALHGLAPEFAALVAGRAARHYRAARPGAEGP